MLYQTRSRLYLPLPLPLFFGELVLKSPALNPQLSIHCSLGLGLQLKLVLHPPPTVLMTPWKSIWLSTFLACIVLVKYISTGIAAVSCSCFIISYLSSNPLGNGSGPTCAASVVVNILNNILDQQVNRNVTNFGMNTLSNEDNLIIIDVREQSAPGKPI